MTEKSPPIGLCGSSILVCLFGFVASLVPFFAYTDSFWGVRAFVGKELFSVDDSSGVTITQIDSGSPVASSGLMRGDRVVKFNGASVERETFWKRLAEVQTGESVILDVRRDGQDLRLVAKGEMRTLEAVLFFDWQFVSAPVFLVLLLTLIATQPLKSPLLWRAILVLLGGVVVIAVTAIVEVTQAKPWTAVWQSKSLSHPVSPALHYSIAASVMLLGLALSFLGAFAVRAFLITKATETPFPKPLV